VTVETTEPDASLVRLVHVTLAGEPDQDWDLSGGSARGRAAA
jgi:hypothetical protein